MQKTIQKLIQIQILEEEDRHDNVAANHLHQS